jgi:hypothetical protein
MEPRNNLERYGLWNAYPVMNSKTPPMVPGEFNLVLFYFGFVSFHIPKLFRFVEFIIR